MGHPPHVLGATLALALGLSSACGSSSPATRTNTRDGRDTRASATRTTGTTIRTSLTPTVRFERLTGAHHDVPVPVIDGAPAAVNDALRAAVAARVSAFEADPAAVMLHDLDKEALLVNRRVADVKLVFDADFGGAHGAMLVDTFVADLGRGRLLAPGDLFPPGDAWLRFLSDQSRAQLAAVDGYQADTATAGTEPKAENFDHLSLTPDALLVTFDAYQVAPFAAGAPTVTVTYDTLRAAGLAGVIDDLVAG